MSKETLESVVKLEPPESRNKATKKRNAPGLFPGAGGTRGFERKV